LYKNTELKKALKDVIPDETRVLRGETIAIATDDLPVM
jgi:hypothetical protein